MRRQIILTRCDWWMVRYHVTTGGSLGDQLKNDNQSVINNQWYWQPCVLVIYLTRSCVMKVEVSLS